MRRHARGLFVVLALAFAVPSSALATDRFASPADQGTGNCLSEINSCDLPTAVSGAAASDDIFVRGDVGDYALSAQLTNANAIHYHGTHGRPRLFFDSATFELKTGSSAENLYTEFAGGFGDVQLRGSTANNLISRSAGAGHAIFMENSTLTNSVGTTAGSGNGEQAIELDQSNTLRNVTASAPASGGVAIVAIGRDPPAPGPDTDTLVNVIARGGSGGAGIRVNQQGTVDITVNVDHSNYSSADVDPTSDDLTKAHLNTDATDQTAAPRFADAGNGDFHQLSCSPTVDSGITNAANGTLDFDGQARVQGVVTDIGADEFVPGGAACPSSSGGPSSAGGGSSLCAYGAPNCESLCTNATTLLVSCANFTASAGFCRLGDDLNLLSGGMPPQCLHPVTPRTLCSNGKAGRQTVCYQTTPGERPNAGSCASMGQALPECNVPNREVAVGCQGVFFAAYSFCSVQNQAVAASYCPPSSATGTPACNFSTTVTSPSKPRGATATAARRKTRRGTQLVVTIGCPKVLAKPRCTGTIAVDGLRTSFLRTLAKQARYSESVYRFFVPGLVGFATPFEQAANRIAKRVLGGTTLPKKVDTAAVIAELGRSDPQTKSFAASLGRAVNEYRRLAGKARKRKKRRRSKRAEASRGTTTLKRFSLKSGRKRVRIRVRLSAATVRLLRRDAAKRSRAPVRVIVSFKAQPRPVVRFVDLAVRVRG